MVQKIDRTVKPPSAEGIQAASVIIERMPEWRHVIKPMMDRAVSNLTKGGSVPGADVAKGLDEFGRYCQQLGKEINTARAMQGVPLPPKPKA